MQARPESNASTPEPRDASGGLSWRLAAVPEVACLLVGTVAALFVGWTLQPDLGWGALVRASAVAWGPQMAALLDVIPESIGALALLVVVAGVTRVVVPSTPR